MSSPYLTSHFVLYARTDVQQRVGAFFRNTLKVPHRTCEICATPVAVTYRRCYQCQSAYGQWSEQIADVVMPLTYAYRRSDLHRATAGRHQSEQHMWSYKASNPGPGCLVDLTAMLLIALQWHRGCAEKLVGQPWTAWSVVPSSKHSRHGRHPLITVGESAGLGNPDANLGLPRVDLVLQGAPSDDRHVRSDRFAVVQSPSVRGLHVLLLEDTWVTGSSVQSAALALKQAGAAAVTALCLARWIREDGQADAAGFFTGLHTPYDPLICPVGSDCVGPSVP